MNRNSRISRNGLIRKIRRFLGKNKDANRRRMSAFRVECLEPRMMLHAGELHDGAEAEAPDYDPTSGYHIHGELTIWVNGSKVAIPQGIGDTVGIHTHDDSGKIHMHPNTTAPGSRTQFLDLGDFFDIWRTDPDAEDRRADAVLSSTQLLNNTVDSTHRLQMFVNGIETTEFQNYQPKDGDRMVLVYSTNPVVVLNTTQGDVPIELLRDRAPGSVNNFLNYVNDGDYNNSIFHRYVPGFIIQGGGFRTSTDTFTNASQFTNVPGDAPIQNEFGLSNTAGTLAMAKLGGDPNSATNQFFLNLANNSGNLDNQNGGFTVFARLLDEAYISDVTDLTRTNAGGAFTDLPIAGTNQLVVLRSVTGDGSIRGTIFQDPDGDGIRDTGENGLANMTVFADANDNRTLDTGEFSDVTDANGAYIVSVPSGQHIMRQQRRPDFNQTFPNVTDSQTVIVQVGREVADINFGNIATQVSFRYEVTDTNGNPVTGAFNVNDEFLLRVFGQDMRATSPNGFGVFAAYQDIGFDASRVTTVGNPTFVAPYTNGTSGTVRPSGELDEYGAFANSLSPLGKDEALIFTQRFRATRGGAAIYTGNQADLSPAHDVLLFGTASAVPPNQISFGLTSLTINGPSGINDIFNVNEDSSNTTLDVLANDTTQGNVQSLTISAVGARNKGGTVTIAANGKTLSYTPAANFFGEETFTYTGTDGGTSYTATAVVQVFPINDPPDAVNDSFSATEDSTNNFYDVLGNDIITPDQTDPGEKLQVLSVVAASAQGGTVTRGSSGTHVLYSPKANFVGTDTFTYTVTDRNTGGLNDTATATVTVSATNDPPTVGNDTFTVAEDSTNNIFDVLINDTTAPDVGETMTITAVTTGSRGGRVSIQTGGAKVIYAPAANFAGTETFTYTVSDGTNTTPGTVTTTVTNVNDNPTAVNDTLTATTNSAPVTLPVLVNDSSAPDTGETLIIQSVTQGSQGGTITLGSGAIQYKPATGFKGTETFTYTIGDGNGGTATATVSINVRDFIPSSIAGSIFIDANANGVKEEGDHPIAGATVTLTGTDSFGVAVQKTAKTLGDGSYKFAELAPGAYVVTETQPAFLADGTDHVFSLFSTVGANDQLNIQLAQETDSVANNFSEVGRQAAFISVRDLFASTPRQAVFAAVHPTTGVMWNSPGLGWENVTINNVQLVNANNQVKVDVTPAGSQTMLTTTVDARRTDQVQLLGQQEGSQLVRLVGPRSAFNFQPVTTSGGNGEGEAPAIFGLPEILVPFDDTSSSISEAQSHRIPALDALFARVGQASTISPDDDFWQREFHSDHDHESAVDQVMAGGA